MKRKQKREKRHFLFEDEAVITVETAWKLQGPLGDYCRRCDRTRQKQ